MVSRRPVRGSGALLPTLAALAAVAGAACTSTSNSAPPRQDAGLVEASNGDAGAGDGTTGADAPAAIAAVDAFISALAAAVCAWEFRCCSLYEIDGMSGSSYLTETDCRWANEMTIGSLFGDAHAAVMANRMVLDPALASTCLNLYVPGGCPSSPSSTDPLWMLALCRDPFVGAVPVGSRCYLRDECVPGSRCVQGGFELDDMGTLTPEGVSPFSTAVVTSAFVGSCLPYAAKGERCRVTVDCAPGLYCRGDDHVCDQPAGSGQACVPINGPLGFAVAGIPCDDATQNLVCFGDACSRLPREGEPCINDGNHPQCDPNPALALACVGEDFNPPGICEKLAAAGAACGPSGLAPCAVDLACLPGDASFGLGSCGPPPNAGQPCGLDGACAVPNVCDLDTRLCMLGGMQHDGEGCAMGSDCASLSCVPTSVDGGTCSPPLNPTAGCIGRSAVSRI